LLSLKLTIK